MSNDCLFSTYGRFSLPLPKQQLSVLQTLGANNKMRWNKTQKTALLIKYTKFCSFIYTVMGRLNVHVVAVALAVEKPPCDCPLSLYICA